MCRYAECHIFLLYCVLCVVMLIVTFFIVILYAVHRYVECHISYFYAECRYAECCNIIVLLGVVDSESRGLSVD